MTDRDSFDGLLALMDRLRGPDGCPWDREQSYATLRGYLLEECYEVVDAIDREDSDALREELGDLLFQIVFLSRLAKEQGRFTARDVVRGIADKMLRRHPHVFGTATAETPEQVLRHWETIKRDEKTPGTDGEPGSMVDGIPRALPAVMKAHRLGTRAARVGFDWPGPREVLEKTDEEVRELRDAVDSGDRERAAAEIGDLLFTVAMLARHLDVDPEAALERANLRFERRFRWVESEARRRGVDLHEADAEVMDRLWNEAKAAEGD